jgi:hypothetical protein
MFFLFFSISFSSASYFLPSLLNSLFFLLILGKKINYFRLIYAKVSRVLPLYLAEPLVLLLSTQIEIFIKHAFTI